jgi:hypothetical protein
MVSVGHVVHSGACRGCIVDALFACPGGTDTDVTKSVVGPVIPNLCFCVRWELQVT